MSPTEDVVTLLENRESVGLRVENVAVERQEVFFREYEQQVLEALTHEESLHLVEPLRAHLKI